MSFAERTSMHAGASTNAADPAAGRRHARVRALRTALGDPDASVRASASRALDFNVFS